MKVNFLKRVGLDVDCIHFLFWDEKSLAAKNAFNIPHARVLKSRRQCTYTKGRESSPKAEDVPGLSSDESLLFISFLD
jgi:hypothetical protein